MVVKCCQSKRLIDHLLNGRQEETARGKRDKDRKERNLASSQDRVARDSHQHGSSGVLLVCSSCVRRWWGSPHRLVAWLFLRCLGRLSRRQWHIGHVPPVPCMCLFLSPVCGRLGRGSVSRYIFHNEVPALQLPLRLVLGGCFFLVWIVFGWPTRSSCSELGCRQALRQLSCLKTWSQTRWHVGPCFRRCGGDGLKKEEEPEQRGGWLPTFAWDAPEPVPAPTEEDGTCQEEEAEAAQDEEEEEEKVEGLYASCHQHR